MTHRAKYLYVAKGIILGDPDTNPMNMILVDQPDGTWRRANGADLTAIGNRFPRFFRTLRELAEERTEDDDTTWP